MKKSLSRKLSLNKTTIASLSDRELQMVKGGEELWGTQALCFASRAENCSAASCEKGKMICVDW